MPDSSSFNNLQSYGAVKFRAGRDSAGSQLQFDRRSNNEGYPSFRDSLSRDLHDPVSSGSLPDVSSFNSRSYAPPSFVGREPGKLNADSINMKVSLTDDIGDDTGDIDERCR